MCKKILKLCLRNLDAKGKNGLVGWLIDRNQKKACKEQIAGRDDSFKSMERSGRIEQDFSYTQA